jgi:hypothetical protein
LLLYLLQHLWGLLVRTDALPVQTELPVVMRLPVQASPQG